LLDGGIAEALGIIHPASIRELLKQGLNFPLDIGRWFLGASAEIHVIFHLQPAKLVFQYRKFFINRQILAPFPGRKRSRGALSGIYHRAQNGSYVLKVHGYTRPAVPLSLWTNSSCPLPFFARSIIFDAGLANLKVLPFILPLNCI